MGLSSLQNTRKKVPFLGLDEKPSQESLQDTLLESLHLWTRVFEGQAREGGETKQGDPGYGRGRQEVFFLFRREWAD